MKRKISLILIIFIILGLFTNISFSASNDYYLKFDANSNNFSQNLQMEKISPGINGKIIIDLSSIKKSQYDITVEIKENKPQNLYYKYNGEKYYSIKDILTNTNINKNRDIVIEYYWDYETGTTKDEIDKNDKIDTLSSKNDITIKINLVKSEIPMKKLPKTGF